MTRYAGLVLAGGLATRMGGGQKTLLEIEGRSLMARILDRLSPQVDCCAINANDDLERYRSFGLPVLHDLVDGYSGPLAGIHAGMVWAAEQGATHVLSVAGDTPFFPSDIAARLAAALEPAQIAMAATQVPGRGLMRQPTFALWPVALADNLEAALRDGMRKVVLWAEPHGVVDVEFSVDPFDPFFNVNTPDDMKVARQIAIGADI